MGVSDADFHQIPSLGALAIHCRPLEFLFLLHTMAKAIFYKHPPQWLLWEHLRLVPLHVCCRNTVQSRHPLLALWCGLSEPLACGPALQRHTHHFRPHTVQACGIIYVAHNWKMFFLLPLALDALLCFPGILICHPPPSQVIHWVKSCSLQGSGSRAALGLSSRVPCPVWFC